MGKHGNTIGNVPMTSQEITDRFRQGDNYKEHYLKYQEYRRLHIHRLNGVFIRVNRRPRPDGICELCGRPTKRLVYHHWDDNNLDMGIWLCHPMCHLFVEVVDGCLVDIDKYLSLKADIMLGYNAE